jgi:cold shock CspA family protein
MIYKGHVLWYNDTAGTGRIFSEDYSDTIIIDGQSIDRFKKTLLPGEPILFDTDFSTKDNNYITSRILPLRDKT